MSDANHDTLENLLRHATPRPVPASDQMAAAKAAVRAEWHEVTRRRGRQRRLVTIAAAATLVVGVFAAFNTFRVQSPAGIPVATIEKSFGPVYLLGERAELRPTDDLSNVLSGQTIVTGDGAGLALAWGAGGSLRIDARTRIRFSANDAVFVEHGRVYFDSQAPLFAGITAGNVPRVAGISAGGAPGFTIETEHGDVRHVGTQYMAEVDAGRLMVSVREGSVDIEGRFHERRISSGQQATFAGRQRPAVLSISRSGEAWEWITQTTPATDVDGRTLHEFLVWATRELGLELRFEGDSESVAHTAILRGRIDTRPENALRLRLATAALEWRIEGGAIYISD